MPLPARFLARLRRLPLRLRGRLGGGTEGLHPSKFKGAGLTFVENRPYVPGDDPRFINWPLTARTGEPILKRFESSRDLVLWLVVDPSPSMFLGDPVSPLRWALELCGAAFATLQATGDRLGLIVPGDDRTPALRLAPKRGRIHGLRILESLAERGPSIPTAAAWREALGHWGEHGKGHRLWLFSNGSGLQGLAPLLKPLATRHRLVWFQPENPQDRRGPAWPEPGFSPAIERQRWDLLDDPVAKLNAWLRAGGRMSTAGHWALGCGLWSLSALAAPTWKAPAQLKLGELQVLELREEDPLKPAPPRPAVEDRLGSLRVRALEPLPDGRGWRFQVQALEPGAPVIPALDLGNGQRSPELRLYVPRSIPYGGPWMGIGGGNDDRLPALPFPWTWASLPLLLPLALAAWVIRNWRQGSPARHLRHAAQAFRRQWPPADRQRETLDTAHGLGRDLLVARFGEPARAWGPADLLARNLSPWDLWAKSLDAARFGRTEPPFPRPEPLVAALDARGEGPVQP